MRDWPDELEEKWEDLKILL